MTHCKNIRPMWFIKLLNSRWKKCSNVNLFPRAIWNLHKLSSRIVFMLKWLLWFSFFFFLFLKLSTTHAGKDVADRWYDEVKQYNFNRPGFTSGTGRSLTSFVLSHLILSLSVCLLHPLHLCPFLFTRCQSLSCFPWHGESCYYSCADVSMWLPNSVTSQGETVNASQLCTSLLNPHAISSRL